MATLVPGKMVRSKEPLLLVENALEPGKWRFQLVVVDDEANESAPADLVVQVDAPAPTRTPIRRPILVEEVDRLTPIRRVGDATLRPLVRPK